MSWLFRWGFTLASPENDCASFTLQLAVHGPPSTLAAYADALNASIALDPATVELFGAAYAPDGSLNLQLAVVIHGDTATLPAILLNWFRISTGSFSAAADSTVSPWSVDLITDVTAYRALYTYLHTSRAVFAAELDAVHASASCTAWKDVQRIAAGQIIAVDRAMDLTRHAWLQGLSV